MRLGAVDFIEKPVDLEKLKGLLSEVYKLSRRTTKQILVVEDNKDMRDSITGFLSSDTVNVKAVETTEEALQQLKDYHFDCMTVDLGLNGKSGLGFLHEVKNDKTLPDIPVIIYTGKNLTLSQEEELEGLSKSVIIKGAKSPERLLDEINLILHRSIKSSTKIECTEEKKKDPPQIDSSKDKPAKAKESAGKSNDILFQDKKILLADDDMRNVFALTHLLEEKGIKVVVARNGQEAIEVLDDNPDTDLVLMDIMMPEMDGYTAIQEIRVNDNFSEIPIIALTAKAMKHDREKCLDAGANDYLTKPIDQSKLFIQMSDWLEKEPEQY